MNARAPLCLLCCEGGASLARDVARALDTEVHASRDVWFACGEGKHVIDVNLRGTDVYLFQSCVLPGSERSVYERLMMLLHAADAARLADADQVTVVLPYLPGSRQDKRKGRTREGVSTGLFARMLQAAGVSRLITVDPHNPALYGCFDPRLCLLETVDPTYVATRFLRRIGQAPPVVASTDAGGLEKARQFAIELSAGLVALSKERDYRQVNSVAQTTVIGEVADRDVLLVDDMVDTGGSLVAAVEALWAAGARNIAVTATHLLLSGPAWNRLTALHAAAQERGVEFHLVGSDTVQHPSPPAWLHTYALGPLLARVVRSVNRRGSVAGVIRPT